MQRPSIFSKVKMNIRIIQRETKAHSFKATQLEAPALRGEPRSPWQQSPYSLYNLGLPTAGSKGLLLVRNYPWSPKKKKKTTSEKRERLYWGLVTVNEENINHLKCCFRAHETEMKHNMKCSFFFWELYFVDIQSLNPLYLVYKVGGKEHYFLVSKILF